MGNAIKTGGGGSSKIVNGIIEEYLAESEDISANTFVGFINKFESRANIYQSYISSAKTEWLSDTKVVLSYYNSPYEYVCIVDFTDGILTVGSSVYYGGNSSYTLTDISIQILSETNFIICGVFNSSFLIYFMSVSGKTISVIGNSTLINSCRGLKTRMMPNNILFFINNRLSCGTAKITTTSATLLYYSISVGINSYADDCGLDIVNASTLFVCGIDYSSNKNMLGSIITLDNTYKPIIVVTTVLMSTDRTFYTKTCSAICMDENKIVIFFDSSYSNHSDASVFIILLDELKSTISVPNLIPFILPEGVSTNYWKRDRVALKLSSEFIIINVDICGKYASLLYRVSESGITLTDSRYNSTVFSNMLKNKSGDKIICDDGNTYIYMISSNILLSSDAYSKIGITKTKATTTTKGKVWLPK